MFNPAPPQSTVCSFCFFAPYLFVRTPARLVTSHYRSPPPPPPADHPPHRILDPPHPTHIIYPPTHYY